MTISFKKEQNSPEELKKILHPLVERWFFSRFSEFSTPQLYGVMPIHSRKNILISAPTGATKTLTGFLAILNELIDLSEKELLEDNVHAIYISPLKALNYDIEVNLLEPLKQMEELAGKELGIRVAVRTGDTKPYERTKMLKKPPHILITTPESLSILLTSRKFRELLRKVQWVITDEVHALAENKRGVHLSLSLEQLQRQGHFTRVGLSATVAPIEEVAKFLVGTDRDCEIVDVQFLKQLDLKVLSPVPNLANTDAETLHKKTYDLLNNLIQNHKTTLIFTNTRAGTERVVHNLKERFPKNYEGKIGAHHGSLSAVHRRSIEKRLREGSLKCAVSSTSLELGIDIGYVDLVILLGSPKSVARALQRVGRSGHQLHAVTKGRIVVTDRDDLVECAVLLKNAVEKKIDRIHIPTSCLDVLAQQIVGMVVEERMDIDELFNTIKKSYCYKTITRADFGEVIDYLTGKFTSLEDRYIFAKIWYNEETGMIGRRGKMGRVIYMTNIGTIPDQTGVKVKIGEQVIGTIDEAFLERLNRGDIFVLAGNTYRFNHARGMSAQVTPVSGCKPTVPSWFSEMLPLSYDLAQDIGKFRQLMEEWLKADKSRTEITQFIHSYLYVDQNAASAIYEYFAEQYDYAQIPTRKKLLVECYIEDSKKTVVFHTLLGRRVNDALSRAVAYAIARLQHRDVEIGISDNGFYVSYVKNVDAVRAFNALNPDELKEILEQAIDRTEVLKRRFRHCAGRALMILRNYKGRTKNVGRQQVSSMILLNTVKRISRDFVILKEARREVLEDLMDIEHAKLFIESIAQKKISIVEIHTTIPSPFSFNLVMQGYADLLKMEDKIEFIRRMHQMVLAKIGKNKVPNVDYQHLLEQKSDSKKDKLKEEMYAVSARQPIPGRVLGELLNLINDENYVLSTRIVNGILKHKKELEKWPKELRAYILKNARIDMGDGITVSYEKLWESEYKDKAEAEREEKERLIMGLERAARRLKLPSFIIYDCRRIIDGDKKDFSRQFIKFLKSEFGGTVNKVWSDDLAGLMRTALKEIT